MTDNTPASVPNKVGGADYLSAMLAGHHLALSIQDAWMSRVKTAVGPLADVQSQIGTTIDKETSFDALITNLCEFFKTNIADLADEMFSHDLSSTMPSEITTIVANSLPNDVAAHYDFDALRHSLRGIVSDFEDQARALPRWKTDGFAKQAEPFIGDLEKGRRKKRKKEIWPAAALAIGLVRATKGDNRKTVEFARGQVGSLIDDLGNLAKATEGKLVDAVLSPQQAS